MYAALLLGFIYFLCIALVAGAAVLLVVLFVLSIVWLLWATVAAIFHLFSWILFVYFLVCVAVFVLGNVLGIAYIVEYLVRPGAADLSPTSAIFFVKQRLRVIGSRVAEVLDESPARVVAAIPAVGAIVGVGLPLTLWGLLCASMLFVFERIDSLLRAFRPSAKLDSTTSTVRHDRGIWIGLHILIVAGLLFGVTWFISQMDGLHYASSVASYLWRVAHLLQDRIGSVVPYPWHHGNPFTWII